MLYLISREMNSSTPGLRDSVPPIVIRPAADTSFNLLDNRPIVFSESGQKIYELNEVGAYIWCKLADGSSVGQIADELAAFGIDGSDAHQFVQQALNQWLDIGLMDFDWNPSAGLRFRTQVARRGVSAQASDAHLLNRLQWVFCHSGDRASRKSDIVIEMMAFGHEVLFRIDGSRTSRCPIDGLAPAVKATLIERFLVRDRTELALHAASVVQDGEGLLMCGAPAAGKSTLMLHLVNAGFRYGGDDVVLVTPDGLAEGLPFAPGVKPGSWEMISKLRSDLDDALVHRRPDGILVRYLPVAELHEGCFSTKWMVFLNRIEGAPADLTPIGQIETMGRVLDGSIAANGRLSQRALAALKRMLAGAKTFELTYSDAPDACRVLANLCRGQ